MVAVFLLISVVLGPDGPNLPAASTVYYLGETQVKTAEGQPLGAMATLMKRDVRPADASIVETSLMLSSKRDEAVKEIRAVMRVAGSTFSLKEQGEGFTGNGTLNGPAWAWTSWTTTTRIPGRLGGTLVAKTVVSERGLTVVKAMLGDDGKPRVTFNEDYATIDDATYELLRSKLLPRGEK